MKSVLVDSSIWIDYFAGKPEAAVLDQLIDHNLICVNGLILAELTPALKLKKQHHLIELLHSVEEISIMIDWERITDYQYTNLKHGINNVGIPDLIVLQNVIDHDLTLFSADRHFLLMQPHIKFSLYKTP
jgi:predicted nucleic acid-binding protein